MTTDFSFIVCGVAGVLFHSLLKLNGLLVDARKANINFKWYRDYVYKDFPSILLSFLSVGIWYLIFHEVAAQYHGISDFARVSFVTMGAIGSYIIQLGLSKAKKQIRSIVDQKTNELDAMKGTDSGSKLN